MLLLAIYLLIINAAAFLFMLADKLKARRGSWRIPEKTLLWLAIFGGSLGALLGMNLLRHKTQHPKFSFGLPLILVCQILIVIASLSWLS